MSVSKDTYPDTSSHGVDNEEKEQFIKNITLLEKRQDQLEEEIERLRSLIQKIDLQYEEKHGALHGRVEELEREVSDIRLELQSVVEEIKTGVSTIQVSVDDINTKQDKTIDIQDKFIKQLWKAFFILLGVITSAAGAIFAITR